MHRCSIDADKVGFTLAAPDFELVLDRIDGLRGVSLCNKLTGTTLDLGRGDEFGVDVDRADKRLWIQGWRIHAGSVEPVAPDGDQGIADGYHQTRFDDSEWRAIRNPLLARNQATDHYLWARTHLFLPPDASDKDLTLVVGGLGLWDYAYHRIFVNGREIGTRIFDTRWVQPGRYPFPIASADRDLLRFGQDNVIAVQLANQRCRPDRLDVVDPNHGHALSTPGAWPPQFEQYMVVGRDMQHAAFHIIGHSVVGTDEELDLLVDLEAPETGLTAVARYELRSDSPVLTKDLTISCNAIGGRRVMTTTLGDYQCGVDVTEGAQGFPVYAADSCFMSLAHPSGWAMGENGRVTLRQYPGRVVLSSSPLTSMLAVIGVSEAGMARQAFLSHVESRMRRVRKGPVESVAVLDFFGAWKYDGPWLDIKPTEEYELGLIEELKASKELTGQGFDYLCHEFWNDTKGDMVSTNAGYPSGFENVIPRIRDAGMDIGLWLDSSWGVWNIGANPVVGLSRVDNANYAESDAFFCRASDPLRTMFVEAFVHHIRRHGARLFKFDNLTSICYNVAHDHLPGIYSTEAIQSSIIEQYGQLAAACPGLFVMLYWGYRSPWWLLHADTLFDCGLAMEAANPSPRPSPYARDGVTITLDRAAEWAADVPRLGKDSLGTWLSNWPWNSCIGSERWQEALVMDLCRGTVMIQPWSDHDWLTPQERIEFWRLAGLQRKHPDCFMHPKMILGSVWKDQAYGYVCGNGERSFVAIYNATWDDASIQLTKMECGMDSSADCVLTVHYVSAGNGRVGYDLSSGEATVVLRPYSVAFFELGPATDEHTASSKAVPFTTPTCVVPVSAAAASEADALVVAADGDENPAVSNCVKRTLRLAFDAPACAADGLLVLGVEMTKDGRMVPTGSMGRLVAIAGAGASADVLAQPVLGRYTYPSSWQAWRIDVPSSHDERRYELTLSACVPAQWELAFSAHFIPAQ